MDCLARREHSLFELRQKLRQKYSSSDEQDIEAVIAQLAGEGLQSDDRFVESFVRYRKSKGFGFNHIRADLLARGVDECLLSKHLFEDDDWNHSLDLLINKRIGDSLLNFGSKEHQRLQRFLESRGFPRPLIRKHLESRLK